MKKPILATPQFNHWMRRLKDTRGKARISARIRKVSLGNMGDIKPVGGRVSELRIHTGPGYRVYLTVRTSDVVILLVGGSKRTQDKDIKVARAMARQYQEEP